MKYGNDKAPKDDKAPKKDDKPKKDKPSFSKQQVSEDTERSMQGKPQKYGAADDDDDEDDAAAAGPASMSASAPTGDDTASPLAPGAGADPTAPPDPTAGADQSAGMQTQLDQLTMLVTQIADKLGIGQPTTGSQVQPGMPPQNSMSGISGAHDPETGEAF